MSDQVQTLVAKLKLETDKQIRSFFARELQQDAELLDRLVAFVGTLSDSVDEIDETEVEEEEEVRSQPLGREAAFDAYARAVRTHARAHTANRTLAARSRNGKIIRWLGTKMLSDDELRAVGQSLQLQASVRRFINPLRRFITGMPGRYRRYRREQQEKGRWYGKQAIAASDISGLELDVVLLAMLRAARELLSHSGLASEVAGGRHPMLRSIQDLYKTQIAVDEATDFSPVQLAIMAALCDPNVQSFLACGDFNQRITSWGTRSVEELKWVFSDIVLRTINITYRHSRQLNELARRIAALSSPDVPGAELPTDVDNEGVMPVLANRLINRNSIAEWLGARIGEIERLTGTLPSVAVLVNGESEVEPLAQSLNRTLANTNIRAVACVRGQSVGQENDVRIFDVQHIKGLEFEGVFFIGIDRLAEKMPDLFDKYLYVGTTRAAFYLGITTESSELPSKIASLKDAFGDRWP